MKRTTKPAWRGLCGFCLARFAFGIPASTAKPEASRKGRLPVPFKKRKSPCPHLAGMSGRWSDGSHSGHCLYPTALHHPGAMALSGAGQVWKDSVLPRFFPSDGLDRLAGCFWAYEPGSAVCGGS